MRKILFMLFLISVMLGSGYAADKDNPPADYQGQIAERPKLVKGDRWEYMRRGRVLSYEFVEEQGGQLMFNKLEDETKTTEFYTLDLNLMRELFEKGEIEEEVNPHRGSLSFPLWVGKKWSYQYSTTKREAKSMPGQLANFEGDVKVVGYEQVKVPAGTFWTFKIEEVRRKVGIKMGVGKSRTVWYSPDVKRGVKTEEEDPAFNRELIKYSVGNAK